MKNKKIIITGASGFIGTSLFRYLKKKGYDVYGVDFNIINKIDEKIFDINLIDYKKKEEFFKRIKPEFIFHLAAFAGPPRNEEKPELAYKYNVELIEVILKNLDNSIPIFFPSTDKIFVGHKFPNEKADLNPDSVHGKVKLECEKLLKRHVKKYFILRQPVVHSAGGYIPNSKMSGSGSFIDQAIDNIRLNKTVKIFYDEGLLLGDYQLKDYFKSFYGEVFYGADDGERNESKAVGFWRRVFEVKEGKTAADLDTLVELYKIFNDSMANIKR